MSIAARRFRRATSASVPTTIYGVNCALAGWSGSPNRGYADRGSWFGRIPCGRDWYDAGTFPTSGGDFTTGGHDWGSAGGTYGEKRANVNFQFSDIDQAHQVAIGTHDAELINYINSVPADWTIYFCYYSEYNLHITAENTIDDFIAAHQHIGTLCAQYAPEGNVIPTICVSSSSFTSGQLPAANTMPANTLVLVDAYGNPSGYTAPDGNTYRNYATPYPSPSSAIDNSYNNIVNTMGYTHWGVGEFNSPQRVAPQLPTYSPTLYWGPYSPYDISGALRAQWISDYCDYLQTKPVRPDLVLLWEGGNGNWNQLFTTAGATAYDDGTSGSPGPHYQGWPVALSTPVQDTLINSYKPYILASP